MSLLATEGIESVQVQVGKEASMDSLLGQEAAGKGGVHNVLPNNQRQCRTCYELYHLLCPVSAAHTSGDISPCRIPE
jgi:hypothetical protein